LEFLSRNNSFRRRLQSAARPFAPRFRKQAPKCTVLES
jgi:hypothetical protein